MTLHNPELDIWLITPYGKTVSYSRKQWSRERESKLALGWKEKEIVETPAIITPDTNKIESITNPIVNPFKPRVVIIDPFQPVYGGISTMIRNWILSAGDRFDIHLVCGRYPLAGIIPENCTIHVAEIGSEIDVIEVLNPDVIFHHYPNHKYGHYNACPVIWIIHADSVLSSPKPTWTTPNRIFCNHIPENLHSTWNPEELTVLNLGVDINLFTPRKLVAGIVGRVSDEKIPGSFIRALKHWENPRHWTIRIIGPCYQFHGIVKNLQTIPFVEIVGPVEPSLVPNEYRKLDCLLCPSIMESGGYQIVEALATGLPVIARNIGGIHHTLGDAGILVDSDYEILTELDKLDCRTRETLSIKARLRAETILPLENHVMAHTEALESCLKPRVSIITSVYNTPREWLVACYEGIKSQTFKQWELIIIDDGSTNQDTINALVEIAKQDRKITLVLDSENRGNALARNVGISLAQTDLIAIMDSDDIPKPTWLQSQLEYINSHPDIDCLGCNIHLMSLNRDTKHPQIIDKNVFAKSVWVINHPGIIYKKSLWESCGGYPNYRVCQDYALWRLFLNHHSIIHNNPDVLVDYRQHDNQLSSATNRNNRLYEMKKIRELIPLE